MRNFMPKEILYTFLTKINKALCKRELLYIKQFFYEVTTILTYVKRTLIPCRDA